jgi:Flp pilus assembly protein TadD
LPGAEQAYRKAVEIDPSVPKFRGALAEVLRRQGRSEEAIAVLREAVTKASADAPIHGRLGNWLLQRGELNGAERAFRTAIKLDPNEGGYRFALAKVLYAKGRFAMGDHSSVIEAVVILSDLIAEAPRDGIFSGQFGRMFERVGGVTGAEMTLRAMLRSNPGDPALHGALAEVLNRQSRSDEALGLLLSFAEGGTRNAHIYAHIGRLRAARGNLAGAAEALRKAIELAPAATGFQKALADLLDRQTDKRNHT